MKSKQNQKGATLIELIVVIMIALCLAAFVSIVAVGCKACKEVSENGLKNTATEIWEGPEKSR